MSLPLHVAFSSLVNLKYQSDSKVLSVVPKNCSTYTTEGLPIFVKSRIAIIAVLNRVFLIIMLFDFGVSRSIC